VPRHSPIRSARSESGRRRTWRSPARVPTGTRGLDTQGVGQGRRETPCRARQQTTSAPTSQTERHGRCLDRILSPRKGRPLLRHLLRAEVPIASFDGLRCCFKETCLADRSRRGCDRWRSPRCAADSVRSRPGPRLLPEPLIRRLAPEGSMRSMEVVEVFSLFQAHVEQACVVDHDPVQHPVETPPGRSGETARPCRSASGSPA
jgi:hypothetical protein